MTNVAYNTNIPFASNSPSQDQPRMQENTNSLKSLIEIDHVGFGNNEGGYHNVIHQPPQVADPAAIVGIGQTYVKTTNGDQQLFFESGLGVVSAISNRSGNGTVAVALIPTTVVTVPNDCIGFVSIETNITGYVWGLTFFSIAGTVYVNWTPNTVVGITQPTKIFLTVSGLDIQVSRIDGANYNAKFKYILWGN